MTRRLRVVRLVPVLDFGGVESRCVLWARFLPRDRFEPRVCTFHGAGKAAGAIREAGVDVDVLGVDPAIRNPRATVALHRYLRAVRPEVVHASIGEANFHAALAGRTARVPRIVLEETGIPGRRVAGRLAYGGLFRTADAVIGVSDATCDYLRREEHVPAARLHRVYNTIDPRFFDALPREAGAVDRLQVVTAGRLVPVKNFAMLMRAFAAVVESFPGARLAIAGDGPERGALESLRRSLGLEAHVELLGFRPDVRPLFAHADLFVLPSLSEGFGLALLEAMASGLPVLATRRGGCAEVVGGLGDRVLLDPEDPEAWTRAILAFARLSPANRLDEGLRARAEADRFAPARHFEALAAIYDGGRGAAARSSR